MMETTLTLFRYPIPLLSLVPSSSCIDQLHQLVSSIFRNLVAVVLSSQHPSVVSMVDHYDAVLQYIWVREGILFASSPLMN